MCSPYPTRSCEPSGYRSHLSFLTRLCEDASPRAHLSGMLCSAADICPVNFLECQLAEEARTLEGGVEGKSVTLVQICGLTIRG